MKLPIRLLQRILILALGVLAVWFIVFVVFDAADRRLPWVLALAVAYGIGAYIVLPYAVRLSQKILKKQRVPRYTITGDGLHGDPVNLTLVGTTAQLRVAFAAAGWAGADRLGIKSSWGMVKSFLFNTPYPTAPFSTLYLFARGQDFGFQKAIDNSPRKRHHIRFWGLDLERAKEGVATKWANASSFERPPDDARVFWIGAGTKDTGMGLTRLTFQITHSTDADTNAERDFIVDELKKAGTLGEMRRLKAGDGLDSGKVNHYFTDGEVTVAQLK
jgi:hypothetical protein